MVFPRNLLVHVRTQTLGQGMKVVLGWVEGMADKVTGLQGAQHRMAQQVQSAREENQFALNATARETISKVKGMLANQQTGATPLPPPGRGGFEAPKPLSRPTTSGPGVGNGGSGPGSGPVVLKSSNAFAEPTHAAMTAARDDVFSAGGVLGCLDTGPLAGPAGAALAGAVPHTGVMGKAAVERFAAEPVGGTLEIGLPRSSADGSHNGTGGGGPRTEGERRKAALDAKRQSLVDSRMKSLPSHLSDVTEPRPPSQPRPDGSLHSAHGISPRNIALEGMPPP